MHTLTDRTLTRNTAFRQLDFRPKLLLVAVITSVAFVWEDPLMGGLLTLAVLVACLAVGVRPTYIAKVLKLMGPFAILLIVTQGFLADALLTSRTGLHPDAFHTLLALPEQWPLIGGARMSREGVLYALNTVFKSLTMVLVIPLAVFTTDADAMIIGLVKAGVPYKIAFIFSSTLRFFPLLFAQAQIILEAQRLRGLAIEELGLLRRAKVYATLAVPLILGAMSRSQQLDVALQARAFSGSSERTYLYESRLATHDYLVLALSLVFLTAAIVGYLTAGIGRFQVRPF
jgi:energy-coupling factor transport system permease protein